MGVFKPQALLLFSFLIWIFFYVQVDATYLYKGSILFPAFTLICFISFFLIGLYSLKGNNVSPIKKASNKKIIQITWLLFALGFFGVILKFYSGYFNSGIFSSGDIFEKRLENMGKEFAGGVSGLIGSILFPFSVVSMLIAIYNYKKFRKTFLLIIVFFGLYPFLETIFMGGRTVIALLGTTLLFALYSSFIKNNTLRLIKLNYNKKTFLSFPSFLMKKRVFIPLILIATVFVSYSINTVSKRLERFDYGNKVLTIWERKDYQWIEFDKSFKVDYLKSENEQKAKMIGLHSLRHYFAHGVFEYVRLVNHLEKTTGYYYGTYEFYTFFKFFKALGVPFPSKFEMAEIIDRQAVYRTFWGEFYIDFGVFGVLIMFFWGRFTKRIFIYAKRQHTQYIIFYSYLSTIIITSFFINFLLGSSSYYLFAFLVTLLIFRIWPQNLKITMK